MGYERLIFWFWKSPTRLKCMQGQKTLSLSYMHLFLPYLLKDSQTIGSFFQTPPLRDANLRWLVWFVDFISISSCLIKQHLWVQCCFVSSVTGETTILPLQKRHLVARNEFAFSFRSTWKSTDGLMPRLFYYANLLSGTAENPTVCLRLKSVGNTVVFSKMTGTQHKIVAVLLSGGQSTQIKYLSKSTDTYN